MVVMTFSAVVFLGFCWLSRKRSSLQTTEVVVVLELGRKRVVEAIEELSFVIWRLQWLINISENPHWNFAYNLLPFFIGDYFVNSKFCMCWLQYFGRFLLGSTISSWLGWLLFFLVQLDKNRFSVRLVDLENSRLVVSGHGVRYENGNKPAKAIF